MAGYTAQQIADFVQNGEGPHSLHAGGHMAESMSTKHDTAVRKMRELQRKMEPHWDGKAGDAAYAGVGPAMTASEVSGKHLQQARDLYNEQGESFTRLKGEVGEGPGPKPDSTFTSDHLSIFTSRDEEIAQWNAKAQRVVDSYNKYSDESRVNSNKWPDDYGELSLPPGGADFSVAKPTSSGGPDGSVTIPGPAGETSAPSSSIPDGSYGSGQGAPIPGPGGPTPGQVSGPSATQQPAASAPQPPGGGYAAPPESGYPGSPYPAGPDTTSNSTSTSGYADPQARSAPGGYGSPNYGAGGYNSPGSGQDGGYRSGTGSGPGGYATGGFGPRGGAAGGFGPQGGAGAGSGGGAGAGRSTGAAPPGNTQSAPVRGGAAAAGSASGSSGAGRMPYGAMGAGAGRGQGGEDEQHETPEYLQEPDPDEYFGPDPDTKTVPPVIGL